MCFITDHFNSPDRSTLPSSFQRKDQIVYNRLRIGHTRLTHSYLIDHTDPPECTNCHQQLSVKHILTECISRRKIQGLAHLSFIHP